MSAIHAPGTVQQLVDTVARDGDRVLIHHDFSQQPEFPVAHPLASFVPNPTRTGWGVWGTAAAVVRSLQHALAHEEFDYFQLLSPTCLPIKPIASFRRHLETQTADVNIDVVGLDDDPRAMMSHGYRAYATAGSLRFRVLRRMNRLWFGDFDEIDQFAGLSFPAAEAIPARPRALGRAAFALTRFARRGVGFSHPFDDELRAYVGNFWFGARRHAVERLASAGLDNPLARHCARLHIPEELYFPTFFANSGLALGPSNHLISPFRDANPVWFDPSHLGMIRASEKHLARKFPNDPSAEIRRIVIDSL